MNSRDRKKRNSDTTSGPHMLLEGISDHFQKQSQLRNQEGDLEFSPQKRGGWQAITKAILNPQDPKHRILQENLHSQLQTIPDENNNDDTLDSSPSFDIDGRRKKKKKKNSSHDQRLLVMTQKMKEYQGQLDEMKLSLKNFQEGMHWQKMQNIKHCSFYNKSSSHQRNNGTNLSSNNRQQVPQETLPPITPDENIFQEKRVNKYQRFRHLSKSTKSSQAKQIQIKQEGQTIPAINKSKNFMPSMRFSLEQKGGVQSSRIKFRNPSENKTIDLTSQEIQGAQTNDRNSSAYGRNMKKFCKLSDSCLKGLQSAQNQNETQRQMTLTQNQWKAKVGGHHLGQMEQPKASSKLAVLAVSASSNNLLYAESIVESKSKERSREALKQQLNRARLKPYTQLLKPLLMQQQALLKGKEN